MADGAKTAQDEGKGARIFVDVPVAHQLSIGVVFEAAFHQVEQPVIKLAMDEFWSQLQRPASERVVLEDTAAHFGASFEHEDLLHTQLEQPLRSREAGRTGPDNHDIHLVHVLCSHPTIDKDSGFPSPTYCQY
jgi:hypothetical protein